MFSALFAALKAVPELISLFRELIDTVRDYLDKQKRIELENWVQEGHDIVATIKGAKNDQERLELAARLSKHLNGIPVGQ